MADLRRSVISPSLPHSLGSSSRPRYDQMPSNESEDNSHVETISHAPTTVDSIQRDGHEAAAGGSVYSYRSTRDRNQFVQEQRGRIFNTLNDMYLLPTDETEWARLDKQHVAFKIAMGGLYPCPEIVEAVLFPSSTGLRRVLDIGCGTGTWALEMALRFPHASVKGIDIAPVPLDQSIFPPNVEFEIDDINYGLSHFYGLYDLIHLRLVKSGFADIYKTMHEVQLCLKPGGLVIMIDHDTGFEEENRMKVKLAKVEGDEDVDGVGEDGSWLARMFHEQTEAIRVSGSDWDRALVYMELGFWDQPLLDPGTAVSGSVYFPNTPWAHSPDPVADQSLQYVGTIMRQIHLNLHQTFHASIGKFGIPESVLEEWSKHVEEEINEMRFRYMSRFTFSWARRRAGDGLPAPPLPALPSQLNLDEGGFDTGKSSRFPYPFFETFHSAETAMAERTRRLKMQRTWPTSAVRRAQAAQQG